MQIRVQVTAEDGRPNVFDLHRWLSEDPDVVSAAEIHLVGEDSPGALGALDVIDVVVSNATALSSLLVAIATWRGARGRDAVTRIEHNGVSLHIEGAGPEEVQRLLRQLADPAAPAAPAGSTASTASTGATGVRPDDQGEAGTSAPAQ